MKFQQALDRPRGGGRAWGLASAFQGSRWEMGEDGLRTLYQFPEAVVANGHKLGGLKQ